MAVSCARTSEAGSLSTPTEQSLAAAETEVVYPVCLVVILTHLGYGPKLHYMGKKSAPETDLCKHAGHKRFLGSPLLSLRDPGPLSS